MAQYDYRFGILGALDFEFESMVRSNLIYTLNTFTRIPAGLLVIILICRASLLYGEEKAPLTLVHFDQPIVLDGKLNEPLWDLVEPVDLVTQLPTYGSPPSERTEILLAYDDNYLYMGGKLYDSHPEQIAANSKKRDAFVGNTDWFGLVLDSYNDKQNALAFFTNPNGLRFDANVLNDAIGQLPINISWNAVWDVAVDINEEGWFVEMRVPFSSIPFQVKGDEIVMGLICSRYIARKNENMIFPAINNDYGEWSAWKPSLAQEVKMVGVKPKKPFYIAPYVTGGLHTTQAMNSSHTGYDSKTTPTYDAGLDVRVGLTSNLNLDLTLNTDFAQVEADDEQVNLTRFSLFFPEKRQFFQERSGIFNYNFGPEDYLFYSRRIGLYEEDPVRILGGARIVGRIGNLDVGALSMQTAAVDSLGLPSLNHSVVRLSKRIINSQSDVGFLVTNQTDFKGNFNTTYGLDSRLLVTKLDFINLRWAQTLKPELKNNPFNKEAGKFWVSMSRQNITGFSYGVSYSYAGTDFDPVLGFQGRDAYNRYGQRTSYGWNAPESSRLLRYGFIYRGVTYWNRLYNLIMDSHASKLGWQYVTKKGSSGELTLNYYREKFFEPYEFSDNVTIPVGTYPFMNGSLMFITSPGKPYFIVSTITAGQFYNGKIQSIEFMPTFNLSSSLELGGAYVFNHLNVADTKDIIHVIRVKALYMFDTKLSLSSLIQYNSTENSILANIRLRYNPREGTDLYLVYNDDINTDRYAFEPILPVHNEHLLILKYTYTFRI